MWWQFAAVIILILVFDVTSEKQEQAPSLESIADARKSSVSMFEYKKHSKRELFERIASTTNPTLDELLSLPSTFNPRHDSNTTVILNHWKRDSLEPQLQALANMSMIPAQIWVCLFSSPREDYYLEIIHRYQPYFPPNALQPIVSPVNFKYYGRFQLALQAHTTYVWIFDDDVLPGPRFLELLLHTIQTQDYRGALGTIGWLMPQLEPGGTYKDYRDFGVMGGLMIPDAKYDIAVDRIQAVDVLCSMWFLERDWLRYLFAELPPTRVSYQTGEDFMLSYLLRKYGGISSFVMPEDTNREVFMGNIDRLRLMGNIYATTDTKMVELRNYLFHKNVQHGGEYMLSSKVLPKRRTFMVYIDPSVDLIAYRQLLRRLLPQQDKYEVLFLLLQNDDGSDCASTLSKISSDIGWLRIEPLCSGAARGVFDLNLQSLPSTTAKSRLVIHAAVSARTILQHAGVDLLLVVSTDDSSLSRSGSYVDNIFQPTSSHEASNPSQRYISSVNTTIAFLLIRQAIIEAADNSGIGHINIAHKDVSIASKLLTLDRVDLNSISFCRPSITAVLHKAPNSMHQLAALRQSALWDTDIHAAMVTSDISEVGHIQRAMVSSGWPAENSHVLLFPAGFAPASTVQEQLPRVRASQRLQSSIQNDHGAPCSKFVTKSHRSSNVQWSADQNMAMCSFLLALQAYTLKDPHEFVLYLGTEVEEISPLLVLYSVASVRVLRKHLSASQFRTGRKDPHCDDMASNDAYHHHLWFIPARAHAHSQNASSATQHKAAVRENKIVTSEVDLQQLVLHGFTGLYPPHTWASLQLGFQMAMHNYGISYFDALASSTVNEQNANPLAILKSTLYNACIHISQTSEQSGCNLALISLPTAGAFIRNNQQELLDVGPNHLSASLEQIVRTLSATSQ